jgi:23S rRNA pseudouridine1911/1915/1917 synthase
METKILQLTVSQEYDGKRLDKFLADSLPDYSRVFLQKIIKVGAVSYGGEVVSLPRFSISGGGLVSVIIQEDDSYIPISENIDLPVLYEDASMLVINKPAGMVVHPGAGNYCGTVVNALLGRNPELADTMPMDNSRPGIVHRLDKDTSGCLVIAKTPQAMFKLSASFAERTVAKTYAAIVRGIPPLPRSTITSQIGRHPVNRQKMAVVQRGGKDATTIYQVVKSGKYDGISVSLLHVQILTGRTHQIRVHTSSQGYPVLGDTTYGGKRPPFVPRQMLHAWKISLPHPETGQVIHFESPFPDDFNAVLNAIDAKD